MPTCSQCQSNVETDDKFCGHCGEELRHSVMPPRSSMTEHALDVTEVKYRLGIIYLKKNDMQGAIKLWREVLEVNPNHQDARDMIQQVEAQLPPG